MGDLSDDDSFSDDLFLEDDSSESDHDEASGSKSFVPKVEWWTRENVRLYHDARTEALTFQHDGQSDPNNEYATIHASTRKRPYFPVTKREVQERWFVVPKAVSDGSVFGIEPPHTIEHHAPGLATTTLLPTDDMYASFSTVATPRSETPELNISELVANFGTVAAGHYNVYLRVKAEGPTSAHLIVQTKIKYQSERGVMDSAYSKIRKDAEEMEQGWHYLMGENQIEVRPHEEFAKVNIRVLRDDKVDRPLQGKLWIRSIELVPVGHEPTDRNAKRVCNRDISPAFSVATRQESSNGIITRLAHSKDGNFLAALMLSSRDIVVQVWKKTDLESGQNNSKDMSTLGAYAIIDWSEATSRHEAEQTPDVRDFSFGLTMSATGNQIAVYQMPRIGEWEDGTHVPKAAFGFHLFSNPLSRNDQVITMADEPQMTSVLGSNPLTPRSTLTRLSTPLTLQNAVGYASYVGQYKDDTGNLTQAKFVFCNGFYLDVFRVESTGLVPIHTISLEGLTPTVSRRFACETTMGSICENMFIWVEDGGRYCSTWDLFNGAAIKRLETSRWRFDNANSKTRMSIARSQNIVAIVGFDNSITTFFADSGIEISRRRFINQRIEFVGFASNQSPLLFVVLRERLQEEFSSKTLDPLRLDNEVDQPHVPIPIRSTIFCHLGLHDREIGVVCQPEGNHINFHLLTESIDVKDSGRHKVETPNTITTSNGIHYELKTRKPSLEDTLIGGEEQCERLVEIWRLSENPPTASTDRTLVFSFIPEPWEQLKPSKGCFLPTGDRFLVWQHRTVQVWSLPGDKEPCQLQYVWSSFDKGATALLGKTETEVVLHAYRRFVSFKCHGFKGCKNETRIRANAVMMDKNGKAGGVGVVSVPNFPMRHTDYRNTAENCFRSIHLLALAYSIVSSGYEETQDAGLRETQHQEHADAILKFINGHINHTMPANRIRGQAPLKGTFVNYINPPPKSGTDTTGNNESTGDATIWTNLLVEEPYQAILCQKLITALLSKDYCSWIPRKYESINPLHAAINRLNSAVVEAFVDYCVKKATASHPSYMLPVVQCFSHLAEFYPEILSSLLQKSSYIPAQSNQLKRTHVTISGFNWRAIGRRISGKHKEHKLSLEDYTYPVFGHHLIILPAKHDIKSRIHYFPSVQEPMGSGAKSATAGLKSEAAKSKSSLAGSISLTSSSSSGTDDHNTVRARYDNGIFVAPFPRLSMYGIDDNGQHKSQSQFSHLAGKEFFDNPAMLAVLRYKWWKYGFWYWLIRFALLSVYYAIFIAVTVMQIDTGSDLRGLNEGDRTWLEQRYLTGNTWYAFIILDLILGSVFLSLEIFQFFTEGIWLYFTSLFNWVDVLSIVLSMACQIIVLTKNRHVPHVPTLSLGPEPISLTSFAIVAMYLHLLFELRVYQPLGIIVNIIIRIVRRIAWFFMIFAFLIIGFSHALAHLLHTARPLCKDGDTFKPIDDNTTLENCTEFASPTGFPSKFFYSVSATLFFLAGRYDFVEDNFGDNFAFHAMMIIFYFFTGLILLNVLIALMNDAYNQCSEEGQLAWLKQWSKVLDEVEMIFLRHIQHWESFRHFFPDYIYYAASIQEVEKYRLKLLAKDGSGGGGSSSSEIVALLNDGAGLGGSLSSARQCNEMKKKISSLEDQLKSQTELLQGLQDLLKANTAALSRHQANHSTNNSNTTSNSNNTINNNSDSNNTLTEMSAVAPGTSDRL